MSIKFSVIIPTLNEEIILPRLLSSLKNQTDKNFEVILVDASSKDKTLEKASQFKKDFPLQIVNTATRNVSVSRNIGASKAKNNILFFIDADNNIPNDFFEIVGKYMTGTKYDVVIPELTPENKKLFYRMLYKIVMFLVYATSFTPRIFSTGSTMFISKKYFDKIGGFDPNLFICEDHDILRRLKKANASIKFISDTYVIFSERRFDQNGFSTYTKYIYSSIYLIFFSKIKNKIYNYDMGGDKFSK